MAVTFTPGMPPLLTRAVPYYGPEYRSLFAGGGRVVAKALAVGVAAWVALAAAVAVVATARPAADRPPDGSGRIDPEAARPGDFAGTGSGGW